ncbi:Zinc finger HIT domain containing protein 3 [Echinococcus multilocularis]|uniref:Zinc finger HIT domain-containing protein 3 n=1 Tax=Echinococcus multilocularis TaxID=6211 RepID=A0A068YBQ4_ECHMU|nr:Zinc finger HIT domain containing protein 3 [Echinococcus multilocularis]
MAVPYLYWSWSALFELAASAVSSVPALISARKPYASAMNDLSGNKSCEVCKSAAWKYKCPSCLLKNCSLNCYKAHKSVCVQPHGEKTEEQPQTEIPLVPLDLGDDCSDYIPTRLLEKLRTSERLKELLSNRHLRDYLVNLDNSRHPAKAIEKAMREPLFVEFADECLRLINQEEARE